VLVGLIIIIIIIINGDDKCINEVFC